MGVIGDEGEFTESDLAPSDRDPTNCQSDPGRYWSSANVGEATPDVLSPMCWSFWGPAFEGAARRAYADLGILSRRQLAVPSDPNELMSAAHFFGRPAMNLDLLRAVFDLVPGMTADDFERDICGAVRPGLPPTPRRLGRSALIAVRAPVALATTARAIRRAGVDQRSWWETNVVGTSAVVDGPGLLRTAEARFVSSMRLHIRGRFALMAMHAQLADLVERAGVPELMTRLLAGMGDVAETVVAEDMWQVSRGSLDVKTFISRHGFHGPDEGNLASRSWREDPSPLESITEVLATRPDTERPSLRAAAVADDRRSAITDLTNALPNARRPVARLLCRLAAAATRTNEMGKASFLMAIDGGRAAARSIGTDLARMGALGEPDDAFYLTSAELLDDLPLDAENLIAFRRTRRSVYRQLELPVTFTGTPKPVVRRKRVGAAGDVVTGVAGSVGIVEGPARVVVDPSRGETLGDGEILVCRATDPSWTPLFLLAKALVIDIGAAASHGAIVAREMGIPCVIGTGDGTLRIGTGDHLRVDGATGEVTIIEKAEDAAPTGIAVHHFGPRDAAAEAPDVYAKASLGNKGYGLAVMADSGLPVPPGFTLPTDACWRFSADGWTDELTAAVDEGLGTLERDAGRRLGDAEHPLLVSVRSGAAVSMPGMMDTVLNVGMTPTVEKALAIATGDEEFAADTHRRFLVAFAQIVGGLDQARITGLVDDPANATPAALRASITAEGVLVPEDPRTQLLEAVQAVFRSWNTPRARAYRDREAIDHDLMTAATVQMMVFGNLGHDSGTGVAFSRHPSTGAPGLVGDFLVCAQGEDVVAGTHETRSLSAMGNLWPEVYDQLAAIAERLERVTKDMVDIEFTVERGTLWILQTRVGKRSPEAVFRTAVDMAEDPDFPVDRTIAVERCRRLLDAPPTMAAPAMDSGQGGDVLASGLAASPGRATGYLCTDIDEAIARNEAGEAVILARAETSPADVHGMAAAVGLITALGGLVSHAAVVARAWALPAVVGVTGLRIDGDGVLCDGVRIDVGEVVTIDGTNGHLLRGHHAETGSEHPAVETVRSWARHIDRASTTANDANDADDAHERSVAPIDVVERALVLKGTATVTALTDVVGADAAVLLHRLAEQGRAEPAGPGWRPTKAAIESHRVADAAVAAECGVAFDDVLDRFGGPDRACKQLVTDWQLGAAGGEQIPNDQNDPADDRALLARLRSEVHVGTSALLADAARLVPRLADYQRRLDRALDRLGAGDRRYMANPLLDSYHTVWFELHEELIRLAGRDRAGEAAAGRA